MNFKPVLLALSFLFLLSTNLYSQDYYKYSGAISYLDGTPIEMSQSDIDHFAVDLVTAPDAYAGYVSDVKNGTLSLSCLVTGNYILRFMGMEIVRFEVSEANDKDISNLPKQLNFPFNYLATTEPNQLIHIYDKNINLVESIKADKEGNIALKGNENYFSDKFLVAVSENGFPTISYFKTQKAANKGRYNSRKVKFSKAQKPIAKRGITHNIQKDFYYVLQKINFTKNKENTIWLLKTFNAKQKKGNIHKLNLSNYKRATEVSLLLDELGRNVIVLKQAIKNSNKYEYQSLIVGENGSLKTDNNTFVYPTYRFKDNFVKGSRWVIHTFQGIALTKGGHSLRISCNGSWTDPNPAAKPRQKLAGEINKLVEEINKAFQENRDIGNSKSLLLTEKREQLSKMPPAPPLSRAGSLVSNESFNVFISPFSDLLWKMDSPLNKDNGNIDSVAYNVKCVEHNPAVKTWSESKNKIIYDRSLDSKLRQEAIANLGEMPTPSCLKFDSTAFYYTRRYRPSGYDPDSELAKKMDEIKDCIIEIDGKAFNYSYKDPYACKGIYMNADNDGLTDEERSQNMESCLRNATIFMGFEGEMENNYTGWGKGIDLFDKTWNLTSNQPINSWEGPYPELRYGFHEILGEYSSMKEAREHCKRPKYNNRSKTYNCIEQKVITVCLDNYQYSILDGKVKTNYEALYCGEKEPEPDNDKGNEIAVDVSAEGYMSTSRALLKRDKEASEIMFSGHILDKEGKPIKDAKVSLRGYNKETETDELGQFNLFAKTRGDEPYSESMDIKLQKIGFEISNEELGIYEEDKPFGLVSDGFTTLKLKVKAGGIRPQTVIVKQPELGSFVEQSVLKVALVLNADGEGEMEYVPPAYLKNDQLTKHLQTNVDPNNQYGLLSQIWVAEVPIEITYEDEEGNPGIFTLKIMVSRPPVFSMHGFTGDESTWATLGNYLRGFKYETYAREYYQGPADESTIQRQSEKLGFYIQKIRESYKAINILQTRIDIVAHSMGGLMSRFYINNMSKYGEKVGNVIPYDVKLSREELAAARNQKPVKLIDVRKLIMVGTPNHGASKIDEIFGVVGALTSDYHQLANGQLRSDSEFFKTLNEGESEGRHLDPNVQYALLYGIRKRSEFYPPDRLFYPWQTSQKNFADDDGVVKVSSAILNGILNIPFPKNWFAMHGFIHSPAMAGPFMFMGDDPITESTSIFEEINILLQEDIKRTPLKNSYAKIIRSDGDAYMKYFSTEDWKAIGPTPIKLRDHWCQIKTDEGSANLGFFLDGHHWGSLHVQANTIVFYEYASPEFVKVYLQKGKARFRSRKQGGGGFEVVLGNHGEKWYEFNPKAKVRDVNTDFIVEEGEVLNVQSINGKVNIGVLPKEGDAIIGKEILAKEGISLNPQGEITKKPLAASGWWTNIDTTFSDDDVIKKSGLRLEIESELPIVKKEEPIVKKIAMPIPNNLPINEDFSKGFENWNHQSTDVECKDEKLYWNDIDQNPISLKTAIPLQNVVIECDVWAEKNGVTLEWFNSENKGYSISLGSYSNKKSLLGVRKGKRYDFSSFSGAHLTFKSWQHYKIVLKKDVLEVYINDTLIGKKLIYQHFKGNGYLSFSSFQSQLGIDNVSIYEGESSVLSAEEIDQQNLLVNGSFEELPLTNSLQSIQKEFAGWKVAKGSIDLMNEDVQASDGKIALDLHGSPGFGSIKQSIETMVGRRYQISFKLSGKPNTLPEIKKCRISAAGESANFEFNITGIDNKNMGWMEKIWSFVAKDTQTEITISSLHQSGPAYGGACIDDVKVTLISEYTDQ